MDRLVPLGLIFLNSYAIAWLTSLEKTDCECSVDWRRTFMKYYYFVVLINAVLALIGTRLPVSYVRFMAGLSAVFIVSAISYIYKLRDIGCDCSKSPQRTMIYLVAIAQAILLLVALY
jgi:hypothetical protein